MSTKIPFLYVGANGTSTRAWWYGPRDMRIEHVTGRLSPERDAWEKAWREDVNKLLPKEEDETPDDELIHDY